MDARQLVDQPDNQVSDADQSPEELLRTIPRQTYPTGLGHGASFLACPPEGRFPPGYRSGPIRQLLASGETSGTKRPFRKPRAVAPPCAKNTGSAGAF